MKKFLILFIFIYSLNYISAQEENTKEESKPESTQSSESSNTSNDPDQGKVREKRKLVISLTSNASAEIRAEYNLNAHFTVGTQFYKRLMDESKNTNLINGSTFYAEENYYNRRGLELFGKYFLFKEGPFYLTLGAGKYLDSGVTRNTLLFTQNRNTTIPTPEAISNTTTINPYWYVKYGAGLQWIFDFGLLINLEANALAPINGSKKSYTYVDERNISINNYYTPVNVFVYDRYFKSTTPSVGGFYQVNIWIGYAFAI
jgi:hypothetical protein